MMSAGDMAALHKASGARASALFLTQMIAHHVGAITMAKTEATAGQTAEVAEMRTLLADL